MNTDPIYDPLVIPEDAPEDVPDMPTDEDYLAALGPCGK